jgi:hypothetical protein
MLKADLLRANDLNPDNANFYYWRSALESEFFPYRHSDDEAEDERLFKEDCRKLDQLRLSDLVHAIRLDPKNGRYYYRRSRFLSGEDARKDFDRAVELGDRIALKIKAESEKQLERSQDPFRLFSRLRDDE